MLRALEDLSVAFGGKASAERLAVYAERLADLEEGATVAAIERILLTRSDGWMPTIGEIRKEVVAGGGEVVGGAEMAWTEVQDQVRKVGWNRGRTFSGGQWHEAEAPVFTSPVTVEAVRSMTWRLICTGEQAEVREQFLWTWKHLAERMLKTTAVGSGGEMALGEGARVAALAGGK